MPVPVLALVPLAVISGLAARIAEAFGRLPASMAIPARWTFVAGGVGMLAATMRSVRFDCSAPMIAAKLRGLDAGLNRTPREKCNRCRDARP